MQRFCWPGYELQLLRELQRQQHNTQFCDTLLQSEGISIPTHSCVLAALSPYLSERLSASPSPPSGQRRRLKLHNVRGKTLVKLVGLLYSGVLEVKGIIEKNDVLAAADTFGIADLMEGQKYAEMKEGDCKRLSKENGREWRHSPKMQDAQVQVEMAGKKDENPDKSCASVGTQTVDEESVGTSGHINPPPSSSLNLSVSLKLQSGTSDEAFVSTRSLRPDIPSDDESTDLASTTAYSNDAVTFPVNNDSSINPNLSESGDSIQERTAGTDRASSEATNGKGDAEMSGQVSRDETQGDKNGETTGAELKKLAERKPMQQMVETTQLSVKVKLRRRTEEEVWEVVSIQDTDETFSVLASLKQNCSMNETSQTDAKNVPPPPSTDHPEVPSPHHSAASNSSDHLSTSFQPLPGVCSTPIQTGESTPPSQPQGCAEESDEQIGKLLEDIMMGLNILPELERGCRKPDGAASMCHVPVRENDSDRLHSAGRCDFCQSDGSTTGIHCCFAAQTQPTSVSLPAPPSDVLQQQSSAWFDSSDRSLESNVKSCQGKLHYPQFQQPPLQEDQHILQLLPLSDRNDTQLDPFSLAQMDDVRLPPCLSPLETSVTTQQLPCNDQQQPWQQKRPWLTENPGSLTFPLSTASQSSLSKRCKEHTEQNPKNIGTCAGREASDGGPAGGAAAPTRKRRRNMLMKERDITRSSNMRSSIVGKQRKTLRNGPKQAQIRTRSFVIKEMTNNTNILGNPAVLIPVIHRAEITNTLLTKRTCERPLKNPPEEESVPVDEDNNEEEMEDKTTCRRCNKRKRSTTSKVELENTAECTNEAENNGDTTEVTPTKWPKMVSLKDFQKLIQRQHSKDKQQQDTDETAGGDKDEMEASRRVDQSGEKADTEEDHVVSSLDENHNQLLDKHREETDGSAHENPGSLFDALEEEEVAKLKSHDEGATNSTLSAASDEDLRHLSQENNTTLDQNLNPKSPVSEAADIGRTSGSVQECEEEEVDILLCSPEKDPQGQACEFGLNCVEMTADEEEEEEVNDIDVTGDEAE